MRVVSLVLCVLIGIASGSCGGDSRSTQPTPVTTTTPTTVTTTIQATTTIPTTTTSIPAGPRTQFGSGQWRVGTDIAAGRYYSAPASGCYWERQKGLGGSVSDIIANEFIGFSARQWIVDILSSDLAFQTDADCGTWFNTPRAGAQTSISPGVWLVGSQITPGTYRADARSGCYWERVRNFENTVQAIIDNEFVSSAGQQLITISSGDAGFRTDSDCGTWTRTTTIVPFSTLRPSNIESNRSRARARWAR